MSVYSTVDKITDRSFPWARAVSVALAVAFWGLFLLIAIQRLNYPFELEWMEGGSVDHVLRVANGESLYCEPTLDFVPYRYGPLYYYVSAPFLELLGPGFAPLRLVSILASLGCGAVIFAFVRRETSDAASGIIASGFFAATFPAGGAWFDLARVDMLFLFLLLAALYVMRFYTSPRSVVLAAALAALSFLTKQLAILVIIPASLVYLTSSRRPAVLFACTLTLLVVGSSIVLDQVYDGWFYYYVFGLGQNLLLANQVPARLMSFLKVLVVKPYPLVCLLAAFYIAYRLVRGPDLRSRLFVLASALGLFVSAFLLWINAGSYYNNLIPLHIALSLLFGLGLAISLSETARRKWKYKRALQLGLYLVCLVQLATLVYDPARHIPTQADREAGERFIETLASFEGEVLVPFHSYIPTMAGKKSHANRMAISDVMVRGDYRARQRILELVRDGLQERRYSAIVLDHNWFDKELRENYDSLSTVFDDDDVFWPMTGWKIRPTSIWIPKVDSVVSGVDGPSADGSESGQ